MHDKEEVDEDEDIDEELGSLVGVGSEVDFEYVGCPSELTVIAGSEEGKPRGGGPGGYTPGEPIPKRPNPASVFGGQNYVVY